MSDRRCGEPAWPCDPADLAPAVLLRLGDPGVRVLCRICAQGPAVATLSIFVEPMTSEFGWSRTALSGAVSLGGVLAALASPLIGPVLDRQGARLMLCAAVLVTSLSTMLLSLTQSLLAFYIFFCIARMNFASTFDIGIYGALNSWFVARRAFASSIANLAQMAGLVALPLIAHAAIEREGWRAGWLAVGTHRAARRLRAELALHGAAAGGRGAAARSPVAGADAVRAGAEARRTTSPSPPSRAARLCARRRSGCCRCSRWRSFPCRPASACTRRRT